MIAMCLLYTCHPTPSYRAILPQIPAKRHDPPHRTAPRSSTSWRAMMDSDHSRSALIERFALTCISSREPCSKSN